jgi:acyl-CoA synthetase (NDP forming)
MLQARSVAVVGASDRAGSVGHQTMSQLLLGGFVGHVYPINPSYDQVDGRQVFPSIDAVGEEIDVAVLAVSNARLEQEVEKAIVAGARSLVIFASCHGPASDGGSLRIRLTTLADEAGVPICGGNGMGLVNIESGLRLCGFFQPIELAPGGVGFLTHSGSLFSAMLHSRRDLGFNLVVSTGLELNTRMSDYLRWVLDLESTTVVALFLETVRDPDNFRGALATAAERSIPIVALKVGTSGRGRAAIATHSEAIAGDTAAYEALFDAYGVHRVQSMDELLDTVELMSSGRQLFRGGLGAVHDSGGERALLIDTAERVGVPLPPISPGTADTIAGLLDPGLEAANPVDAWGTGRNAEDVFVGCLEALGADPAIGVVAFSVDLTAEESLDNAYGAAVVGAARVVEKPVAVLAHVSTTVDPAQARLIRAGGVPVLHGTETGLRAVRHLLDRTDRLDWPKPAPRITSTSRPDGRRPLDLLAAYGIPFATTAEANDLEDTIEAAERIGYPVVLKTSATDHKTDVDGVRVGLATGSALTTAYRDLAARLGPEVTVSRQVPAGVEMSVGMVTDPQFGPIVLVSAGGTLIELMTDRIAMLPPVDVFRATRAVGRLHIAGLLQGRRGAPPADIVAFADLVARFSELVLDMGESIESMDLNPVIVGPESAIAVDLLVKGTL